MATPTKIPAQHTAGTTFQALRALPDYAPADGWSLTYALVKTGQQILLAATDDGNGAHLLSIPASETANWAVGSYKYQGVVTNGVEVHQVDAGTIEILPSFAAAASGYDGRSHARYMVDILEAVIRNRAPKDVLEMELHGRKIKNIPPKDLEEIRLKYMAEVCREAAAAAGKTGSGRMRVRF